MEHSYGFGLAQAKPEGMTYSRDNPEVTPWDTWDDEFDKFFKENFEGKAPYKFFPAIAKKIAMQSWDAALLANARKQSTETI